MQIRYFSGSKASTPNRIAEGPVSVCPQDGISRSRCHKRRAGPRHETRSLSLPVEDDPAQAELAGRALIESGVGLETIIAYDGRQALEYLLAEGAYRGPDASVLPELILVDVKLPELDGFQVLQRIREHHAARYIPVLLLSCRDQEHDIATSYTLGASGYLRKPVDFRQFVEAERAPGAAFPSVGEALSDHGKDLKHVGGAAGSKN